MASKSSAVSFDHRLDLERVEERAKRNARANRELKSALVRMRSEAGLTQRQVADLLGVTQQAVQKFERYDSDPQMSTLLRYANAVGAIVDHAVRRDVVVGNAAQGDKINVIPIDRPSRNRRRRRDNSTTNDWTVRERISEKIGVA